ncbi:amidohydrolase family protein [Halococcus saccharolyticus]|uniref:Metal-dependent hydrolase n=1 Tax=Halococcus saccharolyticus DSM 5350 TaxID=1227455 RepID=M0MHK7_9EURY|nr:amidohydrolase family protein [Halococcus saccharolyticus]EMA45186.1 metal-dependent hydrolase [Halococcus saccharolyticus DSM 5350]
MYRHEDEDVFVIDSHVHHWDASEANIKHEGGEQFIQCFYDYHAAFTPDDRQWDLEEYRKYSSERMIENLFRDGDVDMGIFQPTHLNEFYTEGFNTVDDNAALAEEYPERFVLNGRFDPREGDAGLRELERQKEEYDIQGVKLYTAEWRGDSKGWRLDSEEAFEYLEKCVDLGITNIHPHKGPTIRPLNRDAFDVADVDDAATSFPELNFVVEHVGYPRLDDFCHIATQETNVYGGLAVVAPFAQNRPRKFGNMLGELLFWVGEDNLLFGSDYAIWEPDWLIPAVMDAEMTQDQRDEFGVELTPEVKRKIMGENAAELYDIDIEDKKEALRDDDISAQFDLGDQYESGAAAD